jgi:hypothetical protein
MRLLREWGRQWRGDAGGRKFESTTHDQTWRNVDLIPSP